MEAEAIKLMVQGGAIGLSAGAIVLIGFVLFNVFQGDKRDAAERQRMMTMFENMLARQTQATANSTRQIVAQMRSEFDQSMGQWQDNFNAALERMMTTTQERITEVTEAQTRTLSVMHADIKTVPSETWRLGDPVLEQLRLQLVAHINQRADDIVNQIDPRAENARTVVREELERAKIEFVQECAGVLRRLDDISATVQKLEARHVKTEDPESAPETPETKPIPQEG